jgi:hypothetical protein
MSLKPGTNYTVTKHTAVGGVTSVTKDPFSPTQIGRTHISSQTFTVPTADIHNDDYSIQGGHGLSTGDTIVYWSEGGDSPRRQANTMDPNTDEVDTVGNILYDATPHKMETGDKFAYYNGGGASIGNLTSGDTPYYAIKVDDTKIQVADTLSDALAGNARNLTSQGNNAQSLCRYLQDGEYFYVRKKTADQFYLHDTKEDALAGTNTITLSDTLKGNNSQTFSTPVGRLSPKVD